MLRTFQYRLRPNRAQVSVLERILADNCDLYNAALQERRDAWRMQKRFITLRMQQKQLTELRNEQLEFTQVACDIQRDALRRVDRAFKAFFRRCTSGQKPGFPRFRARQRYDSFGFGVPRISGRLLVVPSLGGIRARGGRWTTGRAKFCTIRRDDKRWTASVVCDIGPAPEKRTVINAVGIDVGLTTLATLSDGKAIENPRWVRHYEKRIAEAGRRLSSKGKGSINRQRARQALRRIHRRAANARTNYLHHVSKQLVADYDLIAHEDLRVSNMARSNLAKGILDAAWGQLIGQLRYKAESAGVWVVPVNPRGTTIRCSGCGADVPKTLADRQHICGCGVSLNRDHNAALNILALGRSAAGLMPSKSIQDSMGVMYINPRAQT